MYQSLKELRSAPGRTALITIVIGLITVMVAFLSSLAAGLEQQSVSGLAPFLDNDSAVIVSDSAAALSSSEISAESVRALQKADPRAQLLSMGRARIDDEPVIVLPDPTLRDGELMVADALAPTVGQRVAVGSEDFSVIGTAGDVWLDHLPVAYAPEGSVAKLSHGVAAVVVREADAVADIAARGVAGVKMLEGNDRFTLSASYEGEQASLKSMTSLLFVISALVVGAFFSVWTVQRQRGIAISAALGASRRVLVADAVGQAVVVLAIGISASLALTVVVGSWISTSGVVPIEINAGTTVLPGLVMATTGLVGATVSLIPIVRVEPRSALAAA